MIEPVTSTPPPLVTREALKSFTLRLVEHFAPQKVSCLAPRPAARLAVIPTQTFWW